MKGKIIVVDDEDNVVGSEYRETVDKKNLTYRVSALWITNSKGEILLARRAYTKIHSPGRWGPAVAGTVEEGEAYEQNIIKEAEEELGLKNITIKIGPKTKNEGKYKHFTQWFECVLDIPITNFKVQEEEVAEVKWFSKEEIKEELEKNPKKFLKKTKNYLNLFQ